MGPKLFPLIRVAVDEMRRPGKFLILGSASQDLIQRSSETLAGRVHFMELTPFTYDELSADRRLEYKDPILLWTRGGFPDSILATSDETSLQWREDFIRTFIERDLPQFGFSIPATRMRRLWTMLAHYHGQTLNTSQIGQAMGVRHPTVRSYIDMLEQTFMVRVLPPLTINTKKRLIKTPKVYIRDSGILHALLEIDSANSLMGHPVVGSSWEGWCIEQILSLMHRWRIGFYRTSSGEEIDLVINRGREKLAFEFKASRSPKVSRGFENTLKVIQPDKIWVVSFVDESWEMRSGAIITNIEGVLKDLKNFV